MRMQSEIFYEFSFCYSNSSHGTTQLINL